MIKEEKYLFVDGSVNPQEKVGYASYLYVSKDDLEKEDFKENTKRFENTSSTKLEIQALLWALENEDYTNVKLIIYTDCQNVIGLENRREKFEKNNYLTKTNKEVKNHLFYKEFFKYLDKMDFSFIKVKGHKKSSLKDDIDKVFTLVDKSSRNALRAEFSK